MAEIEVYPGKLKETAALFTAPKNCLDLYRGNVETVSRNLNGICGSAYVIIAKNIGKVTASMEDASTALKSMKTELEAIAKEYSETEKKVVREYTKIFVHYEAGQSVGNASATVDVDVNDPNKKVESAGANASVWSGALEYDIGDGILVNSSKATALGAEANAKAGYDTTYGNMEAYATADASVYAFKGECTQTVLGGLGKYEATGVVGTAAVDAKAYASLSHNGVFAPSVGAEAEASAAFLKGEAEERFGSDKNNIKFAAEGAFLTAAAGAEAKIGMIQNGSAGDKNQKGKNVAGTWVKAEEQDRGAAYGISVKAGAGAYLARGEVRAGFSIAGIEIEGAVGGKIGGGGEIGGSITSDFIDISAGISALLGVDVEVKIDWSNFGW